ncbi:unnamed protein product [Prunus brigantina]
MVQVCWRRWQRASSMVSKDLRWQRDEFFDVLRWRRWQRASSMVLRWRWGVAEREGGFRWVVREWGL